MKINNKDLIQSYILTTAKYDFDVYEKRILYRLIELAQQDLKGKKLDSNYQINKTLFDDRLVKIPISAFLKDDADKNYSRIKRALEKLRSKTLEYEDEKTWQLIGIIEKPKIDKYDSFVEFEVPAMVWRAILSFARGFRKYELKTAMEFDSVYAMRFYELFSGQKAPITYNIDNLKVIFKIEDKYKQLHDFMRYVVIAAKEELDKKSPYSFEYSFVKTGRKVTAITFHPFYIPENRDPNLERKKLQKQVSVNWSLERPEIEYLKQNFDYNTKEINNNIELFSLAKQHLNFIDELVALKAKTRGKTNPKGYIVRALKGKLKDTGVLHQ